MFLESSRCQARDGRIPDSSLPTVTDFGGGQRLMVLRWRWGKHAWPRAGRSVNHLTRHGVPSLLGGCWGQTQHAGGPTETELHV